MECHKCEHRAAVEAGKFRRVPFENTPCARCNGAARDSYPLEYRDLLPADDALSAEASVPEQAFPVADPPEVLLPLSELSKILAVILALPELELRILRLRRRGLSYGDIAQALGATTGQAVGARLKRLLVRHPVLVPLFPEFRGQVCNLPGK